MHVYLETDRLLLREFTGEDVDLIVELDSDPEVMRFLTGGIPTPRAEIESDVLPAWMSYYRQGEGFGFWAAVEKASGCFIGWFHLRPEPGGPRDEPELGYRLVRKAWGRGYASEGSRALIDKAFRDLGARRVVASTMTVNTGSRRVMEKCGMSFVRTFFAEWPDVIEGSEHGDVEYAITREEWQARNAVPPCP